MNADRYIRKLAKSDLLDLKKNAHLTLREIRDENPKLAKRLDDRFEARARQIVTDQFGSGTSDTLREILEQVDLPMRGDLEYLMLRETALRAVHKFISADKRLASDEDLRRELAAIEEIETATSYSYPLVFGIDKAQYCNQRM
jgi:hypothetical protein